ncbi:DUF1353 domain-containing protein [Chloroflexota bacterium]
MAKDIGPFSTLYVEVLRTGRNFQLTRNLTYRQQGASPIIAPAKSRTDFASITRLVTWLIPKLGNHTYPAVIHDYLCRTAETGKQRTKAD